IRDFHVTGVQTCALPISLQPTSLDIPAGQTVAIVGSTGAGKSTIAKLLARFYDVTHGTITLDGVRLQDLNLETLTRHIVMVTQRSEERRVGKESRSVRAA